MSADRGIALSQVARNVDVIVGFAAQGGLAAKAATSTIPVVFVIGGDPVQVGLVASLNRPGGNVTGTTFMGALSTTKQFGLVHELVPVAKAVGFLMNPDIANAAEEMRDARASAQALGITLETLREIASTGVQFVSVGALTHSASALDLSLTLQAPP